MPTTTEPSTPALAVICLIYPFIAFLFIFFFISGGPVFFDFSYGIIALVASIILGFFIPSKFKMYYFIIVPITIYILLKYVFFYEELIELGKLEALEWVETGAWGGLSLTFIVSFFCLIFCFPIGLFFPRSFTIWHFATV